MKNLLTITAALLTLSSPLHAQDAKPMGMPAHALLIIGGEDISAWIHVANDKVLRYTEQEKGTKFIQKKLIAIESFYFLEPGEFTNAMSLYRSKNYAEAREAFGKCREVFKPLEDLPGNYSILSYYYQLECCRKLGQYDALAELLERFDAKTLTREEHKEQVDIYKYWEAVRKKSWPRLAAIGEAELGKKYSGSHRAQASYCLGLAYEGINKPIKALNQYNHAIVSDYSASEEITSQAVLNCLRIILNNEQVKLAMSLWGTDEYSTSSAGALLIDEANALIQLWEKALGRGAKLPKEYKVFAQYTQTEKQ